VRLPGMQPLARGAQVRLDVLRWNEVDLSIEARLLEVLSGSTAAELPDEAEEDEQAAAAEAASEAASEEAGNETGAQPGVEAGEAQPAVDAPASVEGEAPASP